MLVCKRKEGQWVEVPRKSGDVLRIRVYRITEGDSSRPDDHENDRPGHDIEEAAADV